MEKVFSKILFKVMVVLLFGGIFSACGKDDVGGIDELIGVWEVTEVTYSDGGRESASELGSDVVRIGFQDNVVLVYYEKTDNNWEYEFTGTYTYDDGDLRLYASNGKELDLSGDYVSSNTLAHSLTVTTLKGSDLTIKEYYEEIDESDYAYILFMRVE